MSPTASSWKIKKENGAGPGTYDFMGNEETTQKRRISMAKSTAVRASFTDAHIKMNKYKPSMGHYKKIDNGLKMCGRETLATATIVV